MIPSAPTLLSSGMKFSDNMFIDNRFDGIPPILAQLRNRGISHRWQNSEQGLQVSLSNVHLESDLVLGRQCSGKEYI